MNGMNQEHLNAIKKRLSKTSVGPWIVVEEEFIQNVSSVVGAIHFSKDAHFIAHAREDVTALVAEVERLREALQTIANHNIFTTPQIEIKDFAGKALAGESNEG